jgi:hypothetical protein
MNKTILAGSTALLSDVEVEIVDWVVNEIGILIEIIRSRLWKIMI